MQKKALCERLEVDILLEGLLIVFRQGLKIPEFNFFAPIYLNAPMFFVF
jgi:hypothetical protein